MINILKRATIKSFFLSWVYFRFFRWINKKSKREVEYRKTESLFNYKALAGPLPYYPTSYIKDNSLYGTGFVLQDKINSFDFKRRHLVEHGLILGSLTPDYLKYSFSSAIVTFSDYRKGFLESATNKPVTPIGPYIKYADPLLTESEILRLKKELGKVLLVFPSHSISTLEVNFDENFLINEIEKVRSPFDNVIICLYWKDIMLEKYEPYRRAGYKITTAGHIYDYYFLSRLKTIIMIADFTMSNEVGTHIGYCIALGKPHFLIQQPKTLKKLNSGAERELSLRNDYEMKTYESAKSKIAESFGMFNWDISDRQKAIVKKYWGEW